MPAAPVLAPGLDGVLVGRSRISFVGGETGELVYAGYDVRQLVPGLPFESIVHLLWEGEPPAADPAPGIAGALVAARAIPPALLDAADHLPTRTPPLDTLRTLLSLLGDGRARYPPRREEGIELVARAPVLFARHVRRARGQASVEPDSALGHVANYLWMLDGRRPEAPRVRALESYFDLLADHGMNASTFALRVAISTHSDLFSAATGALGTLQGPLHGGAPSRVSEMLDAIGEADRAEAWIRTRLEQKAVLYGFGHRAYKTDDPRAVTLHALAREVASPKRLALAEAVEATALRLLRAAHPAARLFTNVEYYSAVVLEAIGLAPDLFTPTFALARTAGWTAHALEQARDNRLIRPDVEYVGPPTGRRWPRPVGRA